MNANPGGWIGREIKQPEVDESTNLVTHLSFFMAAGNYGNLPGDRERYDDENNFILPKKEPVTASDDNADSSQEPGEAKKNEKREIQDDVSSSNSKSDNKKSVSDSHSPSGKETATITPHEIVQLPVQDSQDPIISPTPGTSSGRPTMVETEANEHSIKAMLELDIAEESDESNTIKSTRKTHFSASLNCTLAMFSTQA